MANSLTIKGHLTGPITMGAVAVLLDAECKIPKGDLVAQFYGWPYHNCWKHPSLALLIYNVDKVPGTELLPMDNPRN